MNSPLPFSPACERNREPIAQLLQAWLPAAGRVVEIGSGTGQHVEYFARRFPDLEWQPTDQPADLTGLRARIEQAGADNILPPLRLDAAELPWPVAPAEVVYTANTAHIMSWGEAKAMMQGAADVLLPDGLLVIYGPFHYGGKHTSPSNEAFDKELWRRSATMGIRDALELRIVGRDNGLTLQADEAMPANNRTLVFRKSK